MIKFTGKVNIIPSKKKEEQVIKQAPMTKNQAQNKIMNDLALYNNATKKKSVVEKLNQQKKQQTPNFGGTVLEKKGAINDMKEGVPYKVNNNTISKDSSGVTHGGAGRSMDYTFNNKDYENLYNTSKTIKNEDLGTMALELDRISTLPAQDIYKMIGDSQEKLLKQNDIFYGKKMSKDEESKLKLKLDNLNKIYKEKTNKTYGQQQLQNGADTITYSVGNAGNQAVKGFWNGVEYVGELVDKASQRRMNVANKYFESKGEAPKYSQEEINNGNILTRFSDKVINASNNIDESLANKTQNLNNISKKAIEISGAIGNMGTGIATNMILPGTGAGMLAFTTSAAGGYRREGLSRGMTEDQALAYGTINGLLEGATEQISFGTLSKGVKALGVGRYTKALGLQLLGMGENALQEALMEPANEVTALMLNGKNVWQDNEGNITEKSIKDGFKELGSRMIQSGIDGAIVSLVMGGVGSGFQTSINVAQKVLNGEQISQQDIQAMEEELSNAGVDTNNISNQYNQKITEISQQGNQQLALKDVVQQTNDIMPPKTDLNNEGNIITIPKNEANIQTLPSGQENVKMFPQKDNFSVNNNGSNKVKILKNGVEGEFEIRSYNPETKEYFGEVTLDNNTRGFTTIKQEDIVSDIDKNAKTWYNNNEGGDSNERYKGNEQGRNNSGSITNSLQQGGLVGENNKGNGLYNQQGQRGRGSLPGSTNVSRGTNSSSFSNDNDGNSQLTHYKENIVRPDEQIAKKQYVDTIKNEYAKKKISTAKLYNDMTPNDVKTIESIYDGKILNYDELQNANIIKTAENYNETTKDKYEYLKDDTEPTPQQLNNFNKINQEFLKEASTKAKERKAQIIVGLPSSGKSSAVATDLLNKNNAFELDNDIIKALMTNKYLEYDVYDNGKGANNCQNASSYISDNLALPQLLKDGTNVVIPIVGKSEKSIHNKLDKLLEAGYKIELYNVRLPKEKALNRATTRFAESGRYVSLNYINHIDTNAIDNAFNAVKDTPGILYWEIINNDVPFGTKAKIIESSKNSKKSSFSLPTKEQLQEFENKKTKKIEKDAEVLSLGTYKNKMFKNNANAINNTIQTKNNQINLIDEQINKARQELSNKKDKGTKIATTLANRIIRLEKQKADIETKYVSVIDRLENKNSKLNQLKEQVSNDYIPTREEVQSDIIDKTKLEELNLSDINKMSKLSMNNNTPIRLVEKLFKDKKTAESINENFFYKVKHNESERTRFLNKERTEIKDLGIKPGTKESSAVQKYGEGEVVDNKTGKSTPYTLNDLKNEFPESWEKIKNASEVIRKKYDTYIDTINEVLNENGYDAIPKRKDYFRHFEETADLFSKVGIPSKAENLPTDINGLTADRKPGKNFFSSALSRKGNKTSYNAIKGIDDYLDGASKLIYHTEDIQRLRTLEKFVRDTFGATNGTENFNDMSEGEKSLRISQIQEGHLSDFASWLREYTNNLSGKKALGDRGIEEWFGRKAYTTLNLMKKQVGSNLTGFNVNSALSNFISATQGFAKTNKIPFIQGTVDTIKNIFQNDGFVDKSDFLTTRFGSDKLSKTLWEKQSDAGQIFMKGTDYFTANQIVRGKYHEYLQKGYNESEAIKEADKFADKLMAGRGLGDMPNIYNSKILGLVTQFQLETNNQMDSIFYDTFNTDYAKDSKSKFAKNNPKAYNTSVAVFILGQLFAYAWLFNNEKEKLTGTKGALDPIGTIQDAIKYYTSEDLTTSQANKKIFEDITNQLPYASLLTGGGRIPTAESIPNLYKIATGESKIKDEAEKLPNLIFPTGGGQIKKTKKAITTLVEGGDYKTNKDGEKILKFPTGFDTMSKEEQIARTLQALTFGKYSLPNAQRYIDNGFKSLSESRTKDYQEALKKGIDSKEFYSLIDATKGIESDKDKNGEGIPYSKQFKVKEAINSLNIDLDNNQRDAVYKMFDINEKGLKKYEDIIEDVGKEMYYKAYNATRDIEGKKNFKGETISGSVKKAKIKAINDAIPDLTKKDRKALYGIFDLN